MCLGAGESPFIDTHEKCRGSIIILNMKVFLNSLKLLCAFCISFLGGPACGASGH